MTRILITGASGLLGLNLALALGREREVIGLGRRVLASAPFQFVQADLLVPGTMERVLMDSKAEAVIHCAALANLDVCEANPVLAHQVNAVLPEQVAEICARHGVPLLHVSTDAVFDGQKDGTYTETDVPNPTGVYAQTKYEGEQVVLQTYPQAVVTRVNFYGWSLSGKRSLAEFFVNNLMDGKMVNGFTDVIFCPMWAGHLGEILVALLAKGARGLYHVVGPQGMSKYQFGVEIARKFGLNESLISPQSVDKSGLTVRRSHNLWLSTNKLSTELGITLPGFSTGLAGFFEQYQQGYPQTIRGFVKAG